MTFAKAAFRCGVLVGVVVLGVARVGQASITVTDLSQNLMTGEYQYQVELNAAAVVKPGDGFVIFDFPGLITSGLDAPTLPGFSFALNQDLATNAVHAPSPSDVFPFTPNQIDNVVLNDGPPFDNPSVPNLSFVYNGGTNLAPGVLTDYTLTLFSTVDGAGASINTVPTASKDSPTTPDGIFSGFLSAPVPEPTSFLAVGILGAFLCGGRGKRSRA